jgi:hypothetical protein
MAVGTNRTAVAEWKGGPVFGRAVAVRHKDGHAVAWLTSPAVLALAILAVLT